MILYNSEEDQFMYIWFNLMGCMITPLKEGMPIHKGCYDMSVIVIFKQHIQSYTCKYSNDSFVAGKPRSKKTHKNTFCHPLLAAKSKIP